MRSVSCSAEAMAVGGPQPFAQLAMDGAVGFASAVVVQGDQRIEFLAQRQQGRRGGTVGRRALPRIRGTHGGALGELLGWRRDRSSRT